MDLQYFSVDLVQIRGSVSALFTCSEVKHPAENSVSPEFSFSSQLYSH